RCCQRHGPDCRHDLVFYDPAAYLHPRLKAAGYRRVDEARTGDAADRARLAGERKGWAGFDDSAERVAPARFNRKIDGFACDEVRPEADRERCHSALLLRHGTLAQAGVDYSQPTGCLEPF